MATNSIIISATTLFLLLIFFPFYSHAAAAATTAVLDTKGRPLRAHSRYYILPVDQSQGGGLTMLPKNKTTSFCPLYVTLDIYSGIPVWFLPNNPKQHQIIVSSDLNILFNSVNFCLQSAGWMLTVDQTKRRKYVVIGGDIGNPGEDTQSSWFNIEKVQRGDNSENYYYKIVYCPNVCSFCMVICGHVGVIVQEDGTRLLGLTDRPLHVMFKKARRRFMSY